MFQAKELENQYGILVVEPDEETNTAEPDNAHLFCVVYYPAIRNISAKENATKVPLRSIVDIGTVNSCEDDEGLNVVKDMFGYINGSSHIGNCSIAERAKRLEHYQARGLISDRIVSNKYNGSDYNITIEVMSLVERNAKERILKFNRTYPEGHFYVYSYDSGDDKSFDPSLVVILVMAVGTVILGSFWSGHVKNNLRLKKEVLSSLERREDERECIEPQDGSGGADEELSVHVSPLLVMFFVFCMCSMLVLLYFFFNQLGKTADTMNFPKLTFTIITVWVIFGMFCIASSLAMYSCLEPLVMASYSVSWLPVLRLPRCNLYLCILQLELRQFLLLAASIATSATWFAFRKSEWSWILQDILGIMFSIKYGIRIHII